MNNSSLTNNLCNLSITLMIFSLVSYSLPISAFYAGLPEVSTTNVILSFVTIFYLLLVMCKRKVDMKLLLLFIILLAFLLNYLIFNPKNINTGFQLIRGVFSGFLMVSISRYLIDGGKEIVNKRCIQFGYLLSFLAMMQLVAVLYGTDPNFGVDVSSYLKLPEEMNERFEFFRVSPLNGDPNYYAFLFIPGLIFKFKKCMDNRDGWVALLFMLTGLLLTFSRGAILGFCVVVFLMMLFSSGFKAKGKVTIALLSLMITFPAVKLLNDVRADNANSSSSERMVLISKSLNEIDGNIIFGKGIGNSLVELNGLNMASHNTYLEYFMTFGLAGFFMILVIIKMSDFTLVDPQGIFVFLGCSICMLFLNLLIYSPLYIYMAVAIIAMKSRRNN